MIFTIDLIYFCLPFSGYTPEYIHMASLLHDHIFVMPVVRYTDMTLTINMHRHKSKYSCTLI